MPLLANRFHLIAPELPSFGFTKVDAESYRYTFAQLTQTIQAFVDAKTESISKRRTIWQQKEKSWY
jgi:hypothetical protein